MDFEIIEIPSDLNGAQSYVQRYKDFRLLALQTSPGSFGSTYEREIAFTDDIWLARLTNPSVVNLVAVLSGKTLSSLTLLGPLNYSPDEMSPGGNPWTFTSGASPMKYSHWCFNGMFTAPEARGQGIAKALMKKGLEIGALRASEAGLEFVVSIVTGKDNIAARSLYETMGFVVIKEEPFLMHGRSIDVILMNYSPKV